MATGDITVRIRPDGWTAEVSVEGSAYAVGATYTMGYGSGNVPGTGTPYLDVTRAGYDDTGTITSLVDRVYFTQVVRFPYASVRIDGTGSPFTGTFEDGETILQATSLATYVVVGDQSAGLSLYGKVVGGSPNSSDLWTGQTSGATFLPNASPTSLTVPTSDEKDTGTSLVALVALSEYVYSGETATLTCPANWIVSGANNSSARTAASVVTNNSTAAYRPAKGAWSWVPYQRFTPTTRLRVIADERHARSGRPVRCVVFTVTDGSTTVTEIVKRPTVRHDLGDAEPVCEYVTTIDLTAGLTQGAALTANFVVYPWVGDSGSLLDSSAGTALPTPLVGPHTGVCDKTGGYGRAIAVVDASTGVDASGTVVDRASYASDALAEAACVPYLTIGKALAGIAVFNNTNFSHNDVGGGEVCLNAGSYNWLGSSNSYGSTPAAWGIVRASTGVAASAVIIGGTSGNRTAGGRMKLQGVTITSTTAATFSDTSMWVTGCVFDTTGACWNTTGQCVWATHNSITTFTQGFRGNSTANMTWPLVRGNNLDNFLRTIQCYTVCGNVKSTNNAPTAPTILDNISGSATPAATNVILAHNRFMGCNTASGSMHDWATLTVLPVRGYVMVNNVLELTGTTIAEHSTLAASEANANTPVEDVIIKHNTFLGQRQNWFYNSSGSGEKIRRYITVKNNIFFDYNIKTDDFTVGNGGRTGNWSPYYGVGYSGNLLVKLGNGFQNTFTGLNTDATSNWANVISFFGYVDPKCAVALSAGAGNGDYRLRTASPAYRRARDFVWPYGVGGKPRSANNDSAGAHSEGGVRPASMF